MDFEVTYTPEQEAFRAEVRAWLVDNIPSGLKQPIDPGDLSLEQYQKLREIGRRLGAKGWLYPTYPTEYGGGDLAVDFVMILEEELDRYSLHLPPYYDSGGRLGGASIFVWGSEEQKKTLIPPLVSGEKIGCFAITEPDAGSDVAGMRTTAGTSIGLFAGTALTMNANREISLATRAFEVAASVSVDIDSSKDFAIASGKTLAVKAADAISLDAGSADLNLKKDGSVDLKGKDVTIRASGKISATANSDVVIKGSKIKQN